MARGIYMKITQIDIDRFWNKINFPKNLNDCWIYNGCKSFDNGYGAFWLNNKNIGSHRFSYIIHNDFIKLNNKQFICHKCDNHMCVNPNHLFLGSPKQNSEDMVLKNRQARNYGSINGQAILDEADVKQILIDIYNNKYNNIQQICTTYQISYLTIHDILNNKTWKHITKQLQIPLENIRNIIIDKSSNRNTARLSRADVKIIKRELKNNISCKELSERYNVHITTITAIRDNKTWKTVVI